MTLRLLPLLAVSASALLALKLLGMSFDTNPDILPIQEAAAQESDDQADAEVSGGAMPPDLPESLEPAAAPDEAPLFPESLEIGGSAAERAVLESLGERRLDLQQQEGQLDLREKLLQATEERIQRRVDELKELEQRIEAAVEEKRQQEAGEIAGLVTMYESMKPKDAARIFDRLDLPVLLKVVRHMKPRKMAGILGRMSPEAAEKLTIAIAGVGEMPQDDVDEASDALPKIQSN
ncbi:MAG: hypothetical protein JJ902_05985 [Roseibium sp.]|nr:hypothetical protein [Roseibium sp.]